MGGTSGFYLTGGDRHGGVAFALVAQIIFSVIAAWWMYRLILQLLKKRPHPERVAILGAALWFASPIVVPVSMNCLETGLYAMLIIMSTERWHRFWITRSANETRLRGALVVGLWLGATAWARIDTVFLIAAITGSHLLLSLADGKHTLRTRLMESIVMGATSVVILSPWLANNKLRFGSFMPISGTAQSLGSSFGSNFAEVPSKLLEFIFVMFPVPQAVEKQTFLFALVTLVVVVYLVLLVRAFSRLDSDERAMFSVGSVLSLLLVGYYGFALGAEYFIQRYLFPISIFASVFSVIVLCYGYARFESRALVRRAATLFGVFVLLAASGLNLRIYRNGDRHMHFQVVEWTQKNVAEDVWVGAIQTGALGFFHDRTVNLDGKANPDSLKHVLKGTIPEYLTTSEFGPERRRINFLVDWVGVVDWIKLDPLPRHFEVLVRDPENNLGVLKRKGP